MPILNWIGKDKVINHHLDVPFHTLDQEYQFGEPSENKIIHADNLLALKSLLPEYEGRIKCIYIDPPYNTGKEGWVYNDNVNDPKIKKWLQSIVGREGEDLTRHDKWLCMMYPRLKLLNKLLSVDGIIIISLDDSEQASIKFLMDEIFGANNMLLHGVVNKASEIASAYTISKHEYFIIYTKSMQMFSLEGGSRYTISRGTVGNEKQTMPIIEFPKGLKVKNMPDGIYSTSRKIEGSNENIENMDDFVVKDGILDQPVRLKARWRSSNDMRNFFNNKCLPTKAKINGVIEEIYFDGDRFMPYIKKSTSEKFSSMYLENKRGSKSLEEYGLKGRFENPKSTTFIEHLIGICTSDNDIILDSFAGSGTTAHAVLNLNKEDGGNRKFILVEMEDYANDITAERVKRVINGYADVEGTGGGFTYYNLGLPIFDEDGNLNENLGIDKIRNYIYYTETNQYLKKHQYNDTEYFLNKYNDTSYYFYYKSQQVTVLNHDFLGSMKTKAERYIIYADKCLLTKEFMQKRNIIFKKIPRDISKI